MPFREYFALKSAAKIILSGEIPCKQEILSREWDDGPQRRLSDHLTLGV